VSPIERAARALAKSQIGVDEWDAYEDEFKESLKNDVRAVVAALAEASTRMIGRGSLGMPQARPSDALGAAQQCWNAMIDEALTDRAH
jgi:hypothetical protein